MIKFINDNHLHIFLAIGWIISPIISFLQSYVLPDYIFVLQLAIVVGIDTIFGIIYALKCNKFSSSGFGKMFKKIAIYILLLIATHTVSNYHQTGGIEALLGWLDSVVYATIMARELISIFEKTALLGYFTPPKWIKQKLAMFDTETDDSDKTN